MKSSVAMLFADEKLDPRVERDLLKELFAQIERCVKKLPGVLFHHLEPGDVGMFGKMEWNAWLYLQSDDRVFPFRVALETGRTTRYRMRINPDQGKPTDVTVLTALRDLMRDQMSGVDAMTLRLRYWHEKKEEPIRRGAVLQG